MTTDRDDARAATLFLCGDVMTGRGIDQVLAHPGDPRLFEPFVTDAGEYVALADAVSGPVPRRVRDAHIWGDAIGELARRAPIGSIANLETAVTSGGAPWPGKGIHYRMHPKNVGCLTAARLDVCTLANNHVLDFGVDGLIETLDVLTAHGIRTAGAGATLDAAQAPAVLTLLGDSRLLVFALGMSSSGIPDAWRARPDRAGVDLQEDLSPEAAAAIGARIRRAKRPQDVAMVSIHWGDNWGYDVPAAHQRFAHALVDHGADLIHGHSSHHPRPLEVYRDRLILYGCGDFLNDYEGISGYDEYRGDLALMYFPTVRAGAGDLIALTMVPMRIRAFSLVRASHGDAAWLAERLSRASASFGASLALDGSGALGLVRQPT